MRRRPSASARRAVSRGSIAASFRNCARVPAKRRMSRSRRELHAAAASPTTSRGTMAHEPVPHGGHDGSRSGPRGGPSTDALLVIPCCGIANRVRVLLGAVLVGAHANRRVTVGWSKERTLNSSFGALWQPSSFNVEDVEHACGGVNAHDLARLAAAVHAPSWDIPRRAGITCGAYEGPYRPGDVLQGPCVIRGCIMPPTLGPQHAESLFNRAGLATIATIRNATQAIHEARQRAGARPLRLEQLGSRAITRMCSTQARRCRPYGTPRCAVRGCSTRSERTSRPSLPLWSSSAPVSPLRTTACLACTSATRIVARRTARAADRL